MSALRGFTVIELAEGVSGEYCGKLLADFGATVTKVERPVIGSPTRRMAPLVGGNEESTERSGLYAYLNTNKESVALDIASDVDLNTLSTLIEGADVVIDDHDTDWLAAIGLAPERVERGFPSLVFCSITPFGPDAPRDWRLAKSLNVFHASGWGYHTPTAPDCSKPPLKGAGRFMSDYEAALDAAMCIVASLIWRNGGGTGQLIDVAQTEVLISRCDTVVGRLIAGETEPSHERTNFDQGGPHGFFRCAGGAVYLYMTSRKHWAGFCELLGQPAWATRFDDNWLEFAATTAAVAECRAHFATWVADKNKDEVSSIAQRLGLPLVAVNDASDLHRSPQFTFRNYFQRLRHPELGEALYPTVPYKLSASPAMLTAPAPLLGEHATLIPKSRRKEAPSAVTRAMRAAPQTGRGGPLQGVRVLELTKVWAGPYAGKLLAFLGAEVIKVESKRNLDEMRAYGGTDVDHAPYFLSLNPEILSVQINTKSPAGLAMLRDLVAKSDIVLNNLRPGAMERSGLGYEELRKIKPDIVSVSIKMFGNDGPFAYQTGYAPCFASLGGLNQLVGYEGEPPSGTNIRYGDASVGANAAFAAVVALLHRDLTGEGQFVDVSAVECMSSLVGDSLLAYSLTGKIPGPDGNRHADMAPHGCYPCLDGEWLSLAIGSAAEWRSLCELLERSELAADPRFSTLEGRHEERRALDEVLSTITRQHNANELAARLRAGGVAAFKSQSSLELIQSDYLWRRGIFKEVSHERDGSRRIVGAPWHMSKAAASISRGAPQLGEHNAYVYRDILGLSAEKLQELIATGIVD